MDVTVGLTPEDLERILSAVEQMGLRPLVPDVKSFVQQTWVLPTLDQTTGLRVDFIFSWTPYEQEALGRARPVLVQGYPIRFASPEDVIIHKMLAARPRNLEDVGSIPRKQTLDLDYIRSWLSQFDRALGKDFLSNFEDVLRSVNKGSTEGGNPDLYPPSFRKGSPPKRKVFSTVQKLNCWLVLLIAYTIVLLHNKWRVIEQRSQTLANWHVKRHTISNKTTPILYGEPVITGEKIKELRKKLGLTQEELARLLGVGFSTVNRWENNKATPTGQSLVTLNKLKELVEEAEEGEDLDLEDLKEVLRELESGKLVSKLGNFLPKSALGLMATSGMIGLVAGLLASMLLDKLSSEDKEEEK